MSGGLAGAVDDWSGFWFALGAGRLITRGACATGYEPNLPIF